MSKLLEGRTFGWKIGLFGGLVGLVTVIIYLVYSISVGHFNAIVLLLMVLGICGELTVVFTSARSAPLLPAIFFSLAFGMYINDRVIMFEEMINKIYGMNERGAILWAVALILTMQFISIVASIIASFSAERK